MPRSLPPRSALILRLTRPTAKIFLSQVFRIKTRGQENLPNHSGFILLPKHRRWEDIPLLSLAAPRPLYYVAKYELFLNPVSRWFISSLGGIPINRSRPLESRQSLKTMLELLEKGEGIVIFPEGTYYRRRMGLGHVGLIRMIQSRSTVPFIPVGINYAAKSARTLVEINFGRAVYEGSSNRVETFLDQMMKEIARLSGF
ncbi:MAG: lysophospholipid acyltransferase family protein [Desulfobacteraceae bacterium]